MKLVHIQTTVQTVFGVLDDDGNVAPQEPIAGSIQRFAPEAFAEAHDAIKARRDEILVASVEPPDEPPPAGGRLAAFGEMQPLALSQAGARSITALRGHLMGAYAHRRS